MSRYLVGIDLGTSNTVVAYAAAGEAEIRLLPIDQLVGPGEVAAPPLLPSVRYHPAPTPRSANSTLRRCNCPGRLPRKVPDPGQSSAATPAISAPRCRAGW